MVASMTAYARHAGQSACGRAIWEVRSVNHRYLDVSLRLPDEFRGLEAAVRERIDQFVKRGKVDCTLRVEGGQRTGAPIVINQDLVRQLLDVCAQINRLADRPAPISATEILRWPGVIAGEMPDIETIGRELLAVLDGALRGLVETREREGEKLKAIIVQRCADAEVRVGRLRAQLPAIMEGLRNRMFGRIREISTGVDPVRLEQETALLLQKLDVAEELDRLDAHLAEVRRVLSEDQVAGRRLDFLMQELNREANTLGSKSAHLDTTGASVELKLLIEQMREQIQNIE